MSEPLQVRRRTVRTAIADAFLAPSSHNSQPWAVVWSRGESARSARPGESSGIDNLTVCLARRACVTALPAHRSEMLVSAGAFVENLVCSLAAQGVRATTGHALAGTRSIPAGWEPVAGVGLEGSDPEAEGADLRSWFRRRATNRGPFAPDLPITAESRVSGTTSQAFPEAAEACRLHVITDRGRLRHLGGFIERHGAREFTDRDAWSETFGYIRFRRQAQDGLPIDLLMGRRLGSVERPLLRLAMTPRVMSMLARMGLGRSIARGLGKSVAAAPMALYLHARSESPGREDRVAAGALLQAAWLSLARIGVALHPISVILQHEDVRRALREECELPPGRGLVFARAGVPRVTLPPAPRLSDLSERIRVVARRDGEQE